MLARRALVSLLYQGIDITTDLNRDLLSFSYTDNASGEADSVSLSIKDEKKKWLNGWFPEKGDTISPIIQTTNWRFNGDKQKLPCGRFFIDEPEYSGRPSVMTINGISAPLNSNFTETERSRSWRNIALREIARDIASRAGLSLFIVGTINPLYPIIEQTETSDSSFLAELCEKEGLAMKVTDSKIVIFDEQEFEKRKSVTKYKEWSDLVLNYSFKSSLSKTAYAGVNVKYYDIKQKRTIEYLYSPWDIDKEKDKIFQLNAKVNSGEEAKRLAQKKLRNLNKKEVTGSLSVVGNLNLVSSSCIDIEGFGAFDGKYYIQSATQQLNGFTTDLQIRKVLEGY